MLFVSVKRNIKNMLHRKEFLLAINLSILLLIIPVCVDLISFYKSDILYLNPAWYYWGTKGLGTELNPFCGNMSFSARSISLLFSFFLPFLSGMAYASAYIEDIKSGIIKQLIPRTGANTYFRALAGTVFIGGFLIIFIPLVLEQIILCIICPITVVTNTGSSVILDNYATEFLQLPQYLIALQINHPYLFNLIYCVIPSITGGILALCSYVLSLYYQKNKFASITLIGLVVWIVLPFVFGNILGNSFLKLFYQIWPGVDLLYWAIINIAILAINIALNEIKIHTIRNGII